MTPSRGILLLTADTTMAVIAMVREFGEIMTPEEVGDYLRLTTDEVERLLDKGELPAAKIGDRHWRIPADVLDEWLRAAAYRNLAAIRKLEGRQALNRLDALRQRILDRRDGGPFPDGYGADLIREGRP